MRKAELRLDLHKMIDAVQDSTKLSAIYSFLTRNKNLPDSDWGDHTPEVVKSKIVKGLQQEVDGKVISHDAILEKHRKQFPHLNL